MISVGINGAWVASNAFHGARSSDQHGAHSVAHTMQRMAQYACLKASDHFSVAVLLLNDFSHSKCKNRADTVVRSFSRTVNSSIKVHH